MFGKDASRLSSRTIWCSNTDQTGASIVKIMETTRQKSIERARGVCAARGPVHGPCWRAFL
jgi:hypothetical protein